MKQKAEQYYKEKLESFEDSGDRIFTNSDFDIEKVKNVHVSGACGKAMASVAGLFSDAQFTISGSDAACHPPMSIVLDNLGLEYKDFNAENIKNTDVVVAGNVCSPSNPECVYARENNIPQISGAEAVGKFFISDKKSIVVAGTHGKTTTTSLMIHVFTEAAKNPAFLVGGVLGKYNTSYNIGDENTEHFIIEGDEYDTAYFDKAPKFLHYKPYISIITSVEYDHADIYKNVTDYRQAFMFLAEETHKDGKIYIWDEIENKEEIVENTDTEVITYGFTDESQVQVKNLKQISGGQEFDIKIGEREYKSIFLPMSGQHNILNAAVVFATALSENILEVEIKKALASFKGIKKRQEILADKNSILIIDDYAHHPTAIDTTLAGLAQQYSEKNIIAIFEPRSNTARMAEFQQTYVDVFGSAKKVIISTPPFRHNDTAEGFIDMEKLISDLKKNNIDAENIESADKIFNDVSKDLKNNDMVVVMSNGDFGNLAHRLADFVNEK